MASTGGASAGSPEVGGADKEVRSGLQSCESGTETSGEAR